MSKIVTRRRAVAMIADRVASARAPRGASVRVGVVGGAEIWVAMTDV